jgi:hypothetical protein
MIETKSTYLRQYPKQLLTTVLATACISLSTGEDPDAVGRALAREKRDAVAVRHVRGRARTPDSARSHLTRDVLTRSMSTMFFSTLATSPCNERIYTQDGPGELAKKNQLSPSRLLINQAATKHIWRYMGPHRLFAIGPIVRAMNPKLARVAWLKQARGRGSFSSFLLHCDGAAKKNIPLGAHGGLRWAPAAARGVFSSRPWIRRTASAGIFPFGSARLPRCEGGFPFLPLCVRSLREG